MNRTHASRPEGRDTQKGALLVLFIIVLPLLLAVVGLALDFGVFYAAKRSTQIAADAAAKGAALEAAKKAPEADITAAGILDAALNGHVDGDDSTVLIHHPPLAGTRVGDKRFAEATVSQLTPTFFLRFFGLAPATVPSRAVAGMVPGSDNCIYVLDLAYSKALEVSGGGVIDTGCGIKVNSCNTNRGAEVSGGSIVLAENVDVCGPFNETGGGYFDPEPNTGVPPVEDPLAYLPPPTFDPRDCDFIERKLGGTDEILTPGVYCGGIELTGGATGRFQPGNYYVVGAGLRASGGSNMYGEGVFFYNTFDPTHPIKSAQAPNRIEMSGGGDMVMSAPTSGEYAGVLFFADRAAPSSIKNVFSGGSTTKIEGVYYAGHQMLEWSGGGSNTARYTGIVVRTLKFSGGSVFNDDYSQVQGGSPFKSPGGLIE